jgi:hypothetical protein
MTCIRSALVGKKNCPACRNLSSLLLNSLCYIAENTTFFSVDIHLSAWLSNRVKLRVFLDILGKLSKKYQILSAWNYQNLSEIKKNHPALMTWTIHHQSKWAMFKALATGLELRQQLFLAKQLPKGVIG